MRPLSLGSRTSLFPALALLGALCLGSGCGTSSRETTGDGVTTTGGGPGSGGASPGAGANTGGTPGPSAGGHDAGSGGQPDGSGGAPTGPLAFGYVYNLEGVDGVDALPYQNVDYVVHAFVTADSAGNVVGVDYFDTYRAAELVQKVHAAGRKIVLSLGGAGSTWQMAELIGTPARDTFIQNVADKIDEWGYDGVDFDFEFPGNNCTPAEFSDFLRDLKTAVKAKNPELLVMFGISPGWWLQSYEWANLGAIADYGFYFCYDWNNPERGPMTKPETNFNMQGGATIEASCRGALNYIMEQGFPASKLIVGLPFAANGHAPYRNASDDVKTGTPDPHSMEVSDGSGGWWPNVAGTVMKVDAVLDPAQSVLTSGATVAGVGFWEWGEENATTGADLSSAIRDRLDELR